MKRIVFLVTVGLLGALLAACSSSTQPPSPPAAPTSVGAATSAGSVTVSWQEKATGVTGLTIYRWVDGSGGSASSSTKLTSVGGSAASYRDYAVQPSTSYRYAVAATGAGGTSSATTASSAASPTAVTLHSMVAGATDETLLNAAGGRFQTTHPSVQVSVSVPSGDYRTAVDSALGAGTFATDIAELDVVWPAQFTADLVDIGATTGQSVGSDYFAYETAAGTVNGKLVAVPWFADVGLLYYRTDLLQSYFGSSDPPTTWAQLDSMAQTVQSGERSGGNASFWGYVWQGAATESLTCNALEWFASSGGGDIIDSNQVITVNNPQAVAALTRAVNWVQGSQPISPPGEPTMNEEGARAVWNAGNAAFMRNWAYAYSLTAANASLAGKFAVAPLPSTSGATGQGALGGWMLGVAKNSAYPQLAADFVLFATSSAEEVHVATDVGYLPSRPDVYSDASVQTAIPFYATAQTALANAVARPSIVTGSDYDSVSTQVFTRVHNALTGTSSPSTALANLESDLVGITGFSTGAP